MMKKPIFILCLLVISLASCVSKKPVADGSHPMRSKGKPLDAAMMMDKIMATQIPYTWFAASGQGRIDWEGQRFSARINVRILHDSIIWVQIQKFGFEVGRMLVTPDSALFINRFERSYSKYGTDEFLKEYNVPADFEMFSRVFTAGAYIPPLVDSPAVEQDGSLFFQSGNGMSARHWFDNSWFLVRSLVTDPLSREWSAVYADYKRLKTGQTFPFKRSNTIVIDGYSNIFDLEYTSLEIDIPQTFPFSIPSHYEKI